MSSRIQPFTLNGAAGALECILELPDPERFAAPPDRTEEHDHVMHTAAERRPDQDPKRARQKTKLRR